MAFGAPVSMWPAVYDQAQNGGTLFVFRHDPPRGFWWEEGFVDREVLALTEVDVHLIVSEEAIRD